MGLKGISCVLPLVAALCLVLSFAAKAQTETQIVDSILENGPFPSDIKKIKDRGRLVVGQYSGERPMFFMKLPESASARLPEEMTFRLPDGSSIGGADIAVAQEMARTMGVALEIKRDYKSFGDVILAVAAKDVDLGISKLNPTARRMQIVTFSSPYASFNLSILANRKFLLETGDRLDSASGMDVYMAVFDRPEVKIAIQRNSSTFDFAKALFPNATLIPFEHHEECVLATRDGSVDAVINDDFEMLFIGLFDPALEVYCKLLRLPGQTYDICMAVNPESVNLMGIANTVASSSRSKVGPAVSFLNGNRMLLKRIELALLNGTAPSDRKYPFNANLLEKGGEAFGKTAFKTALTSLFVGIPLILFVCAWLALSRRKGGLHHG